MARTDDPTSVTSQFLVVNDASGAHGLDGDYVAFGHMLDGSEALDAISAVPTEMVRSYADVLVEDVTVLSITASSDPKAVTSLNGAPSPPSSSGRSAAPGARAPSHPDHAEDPPLGNPTQGSSRPPRPRSAYLSMSRALRPESPSLPSASPTSGYLPGGVYERIGEPDDPRWVTLDRRAADARLAASDSAGRTHAPAEQG